MWLLMLNQMGFDTRVLNLGKLAAGAEISQAELTGNCDGGNASLAGSKRQIEKGDLASAVIKAWRISPQKGLAFACFKSSTYGRLLK